VIGAVWTGGFVVPPTGVVEGVEPPATSGAAAGAVVEVEVVELEAAAEVPPETLAVPWARAAVGGTVARTAKPNSVEPRARTRKATSSFVGLRG
jgi:hypothetical protein